MQNAFIYQGQAQNLTRAICPRVNKFERGYLYVLQLSNGWTKVGRTSDPLERLSGFRRGFRTTDIQLQEIAITASHINYISNEESILSQFEGVIRDGEFFVCSFSEALKRFSQVEFRLDFTEEEKRQREQSGVDSYNVWADLHGTPRKEG